MNLSDKKVVLTGGAGFIGSTFIEKLINAGVSNLIVIDKMSYASHTEVIDKYGIQLIRGDLADPEVVNKTLDCGPNVIIHMAAESHVDNSISGPDVFIQSNIVATFNLLKRSLKCPELEVFQYINTDEVYGSVEIGFSKETDPRICSSVYSASKGSAEFLVEAYHTTYGLPTLITRSSNNYGPYQHIEKLIPKAITNLLTAKKIGIYGSGTNCRDWIHVADNCDGIIHAITHGEVGQVYNVGGGNVITNNEIISMLCEIMGMDFDSSIEYVTDRAGHDKRYALDTSKLNGFGWAPKFDLRAGLQETVEWYRQKHS